MINEQERKISTLGLNLSQAKDITGEQRNLLNKISWLTEQENKLIRENEKLRNEMLKTESLLNNGGRQIERLNLQKNELVQEVKHLREELYSVKNQDHMHNSKNIQLEERLNQNALSIADLKEGLANAENRSARAEEDLRKSQKDLQAANLRAKDLHAQVDQLKTLCASLENAKSEFIQRYNSKLGECFDQQKTTQSKIKEANDHKVEIQALKQTIAEFQESLREMDKERDQVQDELDRKAQAFQTLQNENGQLKKEFLRTKDKLSDYLGKNEENQFHIQTTAEELILAKKQLQ